MTIDSTFNGRTRFKIQRPVFTASGFFADVDSTAKGHLDELNRLLGRRVLDKSGDLAGARSYASAAAVTKAAPATPSPAAAAAPAAVTFRDLIGRPLTPKRVPSDTWAAGSLLETFSKATEDPNGLTLSEYVETVPELSKLKFQFLRHLADVRPNLEFNAKTVLDEDYGPIIDYLVSLAYLVGKRQEIDGLTNFIFDSAAGAKNVANYAIVSSGRTIVDREQRSVPDANNDRGAFTQKLTSARISLAATAFTSSVKTVIDDVLFNSDEAQIIEKAKIGKIPDAMKPLLIKYIQQSPVPVDATNVNFWLPQFIAQIRGATRTVDVTEVDQAESDADFSVDFLEDDATLIQINRSAVKCAAQLFYAMVLGEELDVFGVMNYFTQRYLVRGDIQIEDRRLREDLQMYVFSNKFTDLKTKKILDRTRPAERQIFYRQVFNEGHGQATEDVIINAEFARLWKVLILESAEYLERAQSAFNPDSYVSRQNVMQAVEDLQYNLSIHCTGMSNVITPLIYAELDFVTRRILMHPEVLRKVVPSGGTWWRVVETLYAGMKQMRPKATVLYNKAKLGHEIIRSIADYNPATFADDESFSAFISAVDAFITTQSILQDSLKDALRKDDENEDEYPQNGHGEGLPGMIKAAAGAVAAAGGKANDEWDF